MCIVLAWIRLGCNGSEFHMAYIVFVVIYNRCYGMVAIVNVEVVFPGGTLG